MTNEEKAREIHATLGIYADAYYGAMEMGKRKDKQFAKEKQQWIEKAAEWVEQYLFDIGYPDDWLRDSQYQKNGKDRFKKAMEEQL